MGKFSVSIFSLFTLASSMNIATYAHADNGDRVELPVKALLVPTVGYDQSSDVQIVVSGFLPNGCYALSGHEIEAVAPNMFRVRQFATRDTSGDCSDTTGLPALKQGLISYNQVISMGRLTAGDYRIIFKKVVVGDQQKLMTVAATIATPPYAEVTEVQAPARINGLDHIVATVVGEIDSSCSSLDEQVKFVREGDVYLILPVVAFEPGAVCSEKTVSFSRKVDLGVAQQPGIYLLQTRGQNGQTIDAVVDVAK